MGGSETAPLIPALDHLRSDAARILTAAIEGVDPHVLTTAAVQRHLEHDSPSRVSLIAAGKAAWPMTLALVDALGSRIGQGIVSGPADDDPLPAWIRHVKGNHPLPGRDSIAAAERALALADAAHASGDEVVVLLSGGASAMLAAPAAGLSLQDKQDTADALMRAGTDIQTLNCVRKHLSAIKGGQLALRAGRCITFALSDVHIPEDDPSTIASGPTVPDPSTYAEALAAIRTRGCGVPERVLSHLDRGVAGDIPETPKPGDAALPSSTYHVIGNRHTAMSAASAEARRLGYAVHVVGPPTRGEARDAGRLFAELALATRPIAGPFCVIASGEPVVTVRGKGRGGRNQEFALGAARTLAVERGATVLASIGTDGIDGPTDAAGGVVSSTTLLRAEAAGVSIERALERNDAYPLLDRLGDLVKWGQTFTNVGDVHILITMGT